VSDTPPAARESRRRSAYQRDRRIWRLVGCGLLCLNLILGGAAVLQIRAIVPAPRPVLADLPTPLPDAATRVARTTRGTPVPPPTLRPEPVRSSGLPARATALSLSRPPDYPQSAPLDLWWDGDEVAGLFRTFDAAASTTLRVESPRSPARVVYRSTSARWYTAAAVSPDRSRVAVLDEEAGQDLCELSVWAVAGPGGQEPRQTGARQPLADRGARGGTCELVAWSPDGAVIATVEDPTTLRIWDRDGQAIPLRRYPPSSAQLPYKTLVAANRALACSPDGSRLALVDSDGLVVLIPREALGLDVRGPLDSGDIVLAHGGDASWRRFAWAPDSRAFAALSEQRLAIWSWDGARAEPRVAHDAPTGETFAVVAWVPQPCPYRVAWVTRRTGTQPAHLWLEGGGSAVAETEVVGFWTSQLAWQEGGSGCKALAGGDEIGIVWRWSP